MILYRIKDWDAHFENYKSRGYDRCSFCCLPNKQDGLGYGRLLALPDGDALYGAFVAVVLMASKQKIPRQGYLTDTGLPDGYPLNAHDIAIKTKFNATRIQAMLDAASNENIGWIETLQTPGVQHPSGIRQVSVQSMERKKEGTEGKNVSGVKKLVQQVADSVRVTDTNVIGTMKAMLSTAFNRPENHSWVYSEEMLLAEICRRKNAREELITILSHLKKLPPDERKFFPPSQSVTKLLERWDEALDRARMTKAPSLKSTPPPPLPSNLKRFKPSPELAKTFRDGYNKQLRKEPNAEETAPAHV